MMDGLSGRGSAAGVAWGLRGGGWEFVIGEDQ